MADSILQRLRTAVPALAGAFAACVLVAVVAFAVLQSVSDADTHSRVDQTATIAQESQSDVPTETTAVTIPNIATIGELGDLESEYLRTVTLRRMLANMDEPESLEFLNQTMSVNYPNLRLRMRKEIVRKLATIAPARTLAQIKDDPKGERILLIEILFEEWLHSGLDDALAYASTLADEERLKVLRTIFRTRDDLSKPSLRQIAHDLGYGGMATRLFEDLIVNSARTNPEDAWNQLLEDSWRDYGQIWSLVDVAKARIEAEGRDVLFEIAEQLPTLKTRTEVVRRLLADMAIRDAPDAFEYARTLHEKTDDSIFRNIVFYWSVDDPHSALEAISTLDDESLREELLDAVASRWAQFDPKELLQNVETFPSTLQARSRRLAVGGIAKSSPQDAIATLSVIPSNEIEGVARHLVYWWATSSMDEVIDWIRNEPVVNDYQASLLSLVLQQHVRTSPEAAMQIALEQPIDASSRNLEYQLISQLVEDNKIEESVALLPSLREGAGQLSAFALVGLQLILNRNIERALGLGEQLTDSQREDYFGRLFNAWAREDPQGLFLSIDALPNQEIRSRAASALLDSDNTLTTEQLDYVSSMEEPGRVRFQDKPIQLITQ